MKNGFVYKRATLRNPVLGTREKTTESTYASGFMLV